jgi:hypothetical protein
MEIIMCLFNCFQYFIGICLIGLMVLAALYLF